MESKEWTFSSIVMDKIVLQSSLIHNTHFGYFVVERTSILDYL